MAETQIAFGEDWKSSLNIPAKVARACTCTHPQFADTGSPACVLKKLECSRPNIYSAGAGILLHLRSLVPQDTRVQTEASAVDLASSKHSARARVYSSRAWLQHLYARACRLRPIASMALSALNSAFGRAGCHQHQGQ